MQTPLNLIKGDKIGTETDYRDQLPVNMTAVIRPMFGAIGYMIQYPGLTQYGSGTGIDRGGLWNERFEQHLRVSGTDFISVDAAGVKTSLGTITGTDTVSLPYSFNTQGIIADGKFWLWDATVGFREVTDSDLGDPIDGVWVDGVYFLTDGDFIFHTDITDESSIDPLKFATAEFMPDKSLGVGKTQDNKAMVFGRYTIEYFVNVAGELFLFQRVATRAVKVGIVGTHTKAELNDKWYILGGRKEGAVSVHSIGVGSATKVASREVDKVIGKYSEVQLSTSVVEAYEEDGYSYLIVHLPNEVLLFNETVYLKTNQPDHAWSILRTDVVGDEQWRGKHAVFETRLGQWVFGDKIDSRLGILDNTVATHYGEISEWLLHTPFTYIDSHSIDKLEIEILPGHTLSLDATVFISLTYDGVTHGKEWTESYGLPAEFSKRFVVHRLGYVRDWVGFKLRGASTSRMAFSRAMIDHG